LLHTVPSLATYSSGKPPRRFASGRLDFDTPLSSIATLPQSPHPFRPHSWLPHKPSQLFLGFLARPFLPSFYLTPRTAFLPPLSTFFLYMPMICPHSCYIGLYCTISSYTGFATRDDVYDVIIIHACTAATRDAVGLIIVLSCYVIVAGAPLSCWPNGVAVRPLSPQSQAVWEHDSLSNTHFQR